MNFGNNNELRIIRLSVIRIFGYICTAQWIVLQYISSLFGDKSILKLIDILHQLLIHFYLLHSYLSGIRKIFSHVVVLFVLYSPFQSGDHFSFPLDQLHLFFHSIEMCIVNIFFRAHPFFFHQLIVHFAHVVTSRIHLSEHHVVVLLVLHYLVGLRGVRGHLLGAHQRRWRVHLLLRNLIHLKLLLILEFLIVLSVTVRWGRPLWHGRLSDTHCLLQGGRHLLR